MAKRRWLTHVYTLEARKLLSYRVDFWMEFIGSIAIELALAYFLWGAVFRSQGYTELGGFSFRGLMLYYVLVPIFGRLVRGAEWHGLIASEIYEGGLTRYLVYPVPFFAFKYAGLMASATLGALQVFLALGAFWLIAGLPAEIHLSAASVLGTIALVPLAALLYFTMSMILEMVAFWMDQVWSLLVMLRFVINLLGGVLIPLTLFSPGWQRALALTPFPYLAAFPYRTLMGEVSVLEWLQACGLLLAWSAVFAAIARVVWRRGLKQYSGVGV